MTDVVLPPVESSGVTKRLLDGIERVGNKVPNPVIMFLYLIALIAIVSAVLSALDVSVTESIAVPVAEVEMTDVPGDLGGTEIPYGGVTADAPEYEIKETTIDVQSLLSISGIRFVFSSFVSNFAAFTVVAVTLVAMAGVGAAEHAGMMAALIRKLVAVAPAGALTFILVLVGVVSSVATDAGYLILIPLGAAAFASVGRHPLAGLAASFAGVAAVFGANLLITPSDSMLTEITNETILANGGTAISVTANLYFSIVSSLVLAGVAALITTRMIEPRLGKWKAGSGDAELAADAEPDVDTEGEKRGLRFALVGLLVMTALVLVMTVPSGAPLRDAETDAIIGDTPFMASLIFLISLTFLVCGVCYGIGARTVKSSNDVIGAIGKTYASLGGLLLMFLMIAQFIAFFNYTNMPRVAAVEMANALESANVSALLLLIGFILVIVLLDFILPGLVPKWAIFAPVFIPIFDRLGVAPQTVLAAYRVGDSPVNTLTPLMVYFPFIVTIARRYDKNAGIGSIIALMIPYAVILLIAWSALFAAWFALGIPLGPDSPVRT